METVQKNKYENKKSIKYIFLDPNLETDMQYKAILNDLPKSFYMKVGEYVTPTKELVEYCENSNLFFIFKVEYIHWVKNKYTAVANVFLSPVDDPLITKTLLDNKETIFKVWKQR